MSNTGTQEIRLQLASRAPVKQLKLQADR